MHAPVKELLKRQDVEALDAPTVPRPALNRVAPEPDAAYRIPAGFYAAPVQGMLHPALDPDADIEALYDQQPEGF